MRRWHDLDEHLAQLVLVVQLLLGREPHGTATLQQLEPEARWKSAYPPAAS